MNVKKTQVLSSLFWKLMERGGTHGIRFILEILLARMLLPEDFGLFAIVLIFVNIANVFVQSGLNTALVQKKDTDETDFSSVFFLSLFIACLIYVILFFGAPIIANFYDKPQLISVFRVISIILFFGAFNSVQNAFIARKMQFKKLFFSSTGAMIGSGILGIYLAYTGFGIWALVVQQISNQFLSVIILMFTIQWRPKAEFSLTRIKGLFSFGWKLLAASLIDTIYQDLRSLIIGKMFTAEILGFYNRGQQFPSLIISDINGSIQSVMLPVLAAQQDNRTRVKEMMRRAIVTSSFVIFPMMVGLAVVAEPLVQLLLTDKWLQCVPFVQIFCASYALWPIHTANLQAINALGRSDIFLKLEIIKKVIGLSILVVTLFYGVYAIALGTVLGGIISTVINAYPNKKMLDYSFFDQWNDIMPSLLLSLVMGAVVYSITWLGFSVFRTLIIQVCIGVILYVGMAWVLKLECFRYLLNMLSKLAQGQEVK